MINSEDEIYIDDRRSCTRDEAIAKMLGWMRGHVRKKIIKVTVQGISVDQLADLPSLDIPILKMLNDLRDGGRQDFIQAFDDDAEPDVIISKDETVAMLDDLINKAVAYGLALDHEVSLPQSALFIDRLATEETGITHFTLYSVDQWARRQWGVAIEPSFSQGGLPDVVSVPQGLASEPCEQAKAETADSENAAMPRRRQLDQVEAIVTELERQGHDPKAIPRNDPGKGGV